MFRLRCAPQTFAFLRLRKISPGFPDSACGCARNGNGRTHEMPGKRTRDGTLCHPEFIEESPWMPAGDALTLLRSDRNDAERAICRKANDRLGLKKQADDLPKSTIYAILQLHFKFT